MGVAMVTTQIKTQSRLRTEVLQSKSIRCTTNDTILCALPLTGPEPERAQCNSNATYTAIYFESVGLKVR